LISFARELKITASLIKNAPPMVAGPMVGEVVQAIELQEKKLFSASNVAEGEAEYTIEPLSLDLVFVATRLLIFTEESEVALD
jgi:hypothetical protein